MNIMFFSTHILWPSHYETELELIQRHLDDGKNVIQVVCNNHLNTCDQNHDHKIGICIKCIAKRVAGKLLLTKKIDNLTIYLSHGSFDEKLSSLKKEFANIGELLGYSINGFDIGYAVGSSLISWLRNPAPDTLIYKKIINSYMESAFQVYITAQKYLEEYKIDSVYVFNGRFAHARAVFRACQSKNVDCIIHERGHDIHSYALYKNVFPHDIKNTDYLIRNSWLTAATECNKEKIGASFFENLANGVEQSWYSFVNMQEKGLLPDGWKPDAMNIVIYNSSEDEFVAIGDEWKRSIYSNQLEAVKRIIDSLEEKYDSTFHVYLRMHPNNSGMPDHELKKWYAIKLRILTIIPPDSKISSYFLLKNADKILTFGSTIGIEAVFWEKPSILVGPSFYRNLEATFNPESHEEVIKLLINKLKPKNKIFALMYGYYMSTFGIPFKYFKAESFSSGSFAGFNLNQRRSVLILKLLAKILCLIK